MTSTVDSAATRPDVATTALLALVPAVIVLGTAALVGALAGRPDVFGVVRVYQVVMDVTVVTRFFGMFVSVIVVWGVLRSRQASRGLLAVAVLSGPVAYAFTAFLGASQFFPVGPAAYYGVNPMFVASVASQCAIAGIAEALWRWRQRSKGADRPVLTWRLAAIVVGGLAVLFFAVLWQGGVPFFFWYQRGYLLLFT